MGEHIDELIDSIAQLWKEHPQMRFGELIYKLLCIMPCRQEDISDMLYYVSDESILEFLEGME